jgi:hypothetical protein
MVRVRSSPGAFLQRHHGTNRNRQLFTGAADVWFARPSEVRQLGNAQVDSFTGPSAFSSDFSHTKNFTITERVQAQFRFDAYNIFNHPILGFNSNQGNSCLDCGGSAGKITDIEADASPVRRTACGNAVWRSRDVFLVSARRNLRKNPGLS